MQSAWGPIFQATPGELLSDALAQLEPFVQDTASAWSSIGLPEAEDFQRTAKCAFPSKVGLDGVPHSAYRIPYEGKILQSQFFSQTAGQFLDIDFNQKRRSILKQMSRLMLLALSSVHHLISG